MPRHIVFLLAIAAFGSAAHLLDRYLEKMNVINTHNSNPNRTYDMGFNHIAALSPDEYKRLLGYRAPDKRLLTRENSAAVFKTPPNYTAPDAVDWRKNGAVSSVKDQGKCGSCWAFSAVGALEGQHVIKKKGKMIDLSEQNLIDCSTEYGTAGCSGGNMEAAFSYVRDNGGIDTNASYPYQAKDDTCRFNKSDVGETDNGYVSISSGDEEALKNAVALIGPISVAIDAPKNITKYSTGVFYDPKCSSTSLNHGVLLVGYGTDSKAGDYWLVKNSWGTRWGEKGYIKMARNRNNHCGIATDASYPIVTPNNPPLA